MAPIDFDRAKASYRGELPDSTLLDGRCHVSSRVVKQRLRANNNQRSHTLGGMVAGDFGIARSSLQLRINQARRGAPVLKKMNRWFGGNGVKMRHVEYAAR
jgi:hypothetical protein